MIVVFQAFPIGQGLQEGRADPEDGFDRAGVSGIAQITGLEPFAQAKAQGIDEDRFAGSGFPCQDVQFFGELDRNILDNAEIFDGQGFKHGAMIAKIAKKNIPSLHKFTHLIV